MLRVILDSHLRTPTDAALLADADGDVLFIATPGAPAEAEMRLRSLGAEIIRVQGASEAGALYLHAVLQHLHERSIRSVLLEAGSAVNGSFLAADLVDRAVLYFRESELGNDAVPFAAGQPSPYALQERLTGIKRAAFPHGTQSASEDVRISGYLHDPWAALP